MEFANPLGWYAFLAIVPLVIIYLMRPRPKEQKIPSLMFFMRANKITRQAAFFRQLITSLLFLLQLLVLAVLAFSIVSPFLPVPGISTADHTVIVLDVSASMQTEDGSTTRFKKAVSEARGVLEGKISIVLAENIPLIVLEDGSRKEASDILSKVKARDTTSNIGDSMILAGDLMSNKNGRVYVISDFIATEGPDPIVAQRALTSRELDVHFIDVSNDANNIGIIELVVGKFESKAQVKNYNSEKKRVKLSLKGDKVNAEFTKSILGNSIETYSFATPAGTTKLSLESDDFPADNQAFISAPLEKYISVLLVTGELVSGSCEKVQTNVEAALKASKETDLHADRGEAVLPVVPSLEFDVVVLSDFSRQCLEPVINELKFSIGNTTDLVIMGHDNLDTIDADMLPVKITGKRNGSKITKTIENQMTRDIEFGIAEQYLIAEPKNGTVVLAEAADGSPMLAMMEYNSGHIIYYGIMDKYSNFKTSIHYPIFWNRLMNFLVRAEDLSDYNFKTGRVMPVDMQTVSLPSGNIETSKVFFDEAGIYTVGRKKIAASLLSEEESDVSKSKEELEEEQKQFYIKEREQTDELSFEYLLIIIAGLIILGELIYVKRRGDM
ncbi:MAG: VWA domain-containing protein [bacterium]|nr:VWA domain-containing protein [bacterium]